ncbi:DUF3187 family protein [Geobacter sp. AOG2]|uniref:DUF3187 family protein n=1 Tax=Geobacter sp. AOG2 TaxID=1566347 RepID=UPI001CC82D27|nr:DUF3187 family protein [Geobacter sp. AOG2]GFE59999.1 hypothetical protein AOG2_05870 [Geobacter sp. AOG2]
MNKVLSLSLLLLIVMAGPATAADMEITPFRTVNQSPLVQIFGLPAQSEATVAPPGSAIVSLVQDVASDYTISSTPHEQIHLDGESYRWTLAARYGFGGRFDAGLEVPYVLYGGGFLDSFIIGWHDFFGLPQGGRDSAPKNKLSFSYTKDGVQKLKVDHAGSGIGDISLTAGMQLYDARDNESHDSLALRASLKLPSGDSNALRGSGSTDVALSLCGSMNNFTEWGSLGVFGSMGGMVMSDGDILRDQQQNFVGFGTAGLGWGPEPWISFKFQLNGHTAFYRGSSLDELSKPSLMLVSGGALRLPGDYRLDIGVSEDVAVATAPDVAFHLGVSKQF